MINCYRTCQIFKEGWMDAQFKDIECGDKFRLFEPTGELLVGDNGLTEFIAISDAFIDIDSNIYCVKIQD